MPMITLQGALQKQMHITCIYPLHMHMITLHLQ
jgi:hypothetical protein